MCMTYNKFLGQFTQQQQNVGQIYATECFISVYLLFLLLNEILLHTNFSHILSFFLSIFTGSLIYEHYTRECEFGNFDKIKNKKHTKKKTTQKKHKNFWLNFCLNKECPKLLCGLGICHRRRHLPHSVPLESVFRHNLFSVS